MAGLDTDPLHMARVAQDGQARCLLCSTVEPAAEHDWCRAASGLVCEDCCHRVLLGDLGRILASAFSGSGPDPELGACAECERGQRWFARQVLGAMTPRTLPS
jgi:hypothetical protein